jgi:hypothetical protein
MIPPSNKFNRKARSSKIKTYLLAATIAIAGAKYLS